MSLQASLVYNGVTVDLQADSRTLLDGFYPQVVQQSAVSVSESFDVWIKGDTTAEREEAVRSINRAFGWAREMRGVQACQLNWAMDEGADTWQTKVLDGYVSFDERLVNRWRSGRVKARVVVEHEPGWEGPEESLPLSNGNGTDVTTGLPIFNCNDGIGASPAKRHNYAEIQGTDVDGDLPARTRLEIKNLDATRRLYDMWIGQNWTDPSHYVEVLEAESATGVTLTSAETCSGGAYVSISLAGNNSEATLLRWDLSTALLSAARGRWIHALVRFADTDWITDTQFRLALEWNVNTVWASGQVIPSSDRAICLRDLFQFRLPPGLAELDGLDGMSLVLSGQQNSGAARDIDIDCVFLMPADGWRYAVCNGYGVGLNSRIIDDGINGNMYRDDGIGTGKVAILTGYGRPIELQPGRTQRLYFVYHSHLGNTAPINHPIAVKVYYRPRKASL